jgi:hypothetical protein
MKVLNHLGRRARTVALLAGIMAMGFPGAAKTASLVDVQTAIKAWNAKPRQGETTATMEARVGKRLSEMLDTDPAKLESDGSHWDLLSYLREYPWKQMPEKRKAWYLEKMPNLRLTDEQRAVLLKDAQDKPLYDITPKELDVYLAWAQAEFPDLRSRVMHYARKRVGQPYDMYLLGEFPYEVYDPQPLFQLAKSDCVVFCEHTYAMALSGDWKEFFQTLQKIRYKNGEIGMLTRNHYTEADWNKNNSWLVEDVTSKLGATTVTKYRERIDRETFFGKFGIGKGIPVQMLEDDYIPADAVMGVLGKLQDGDFVNIARGKGDGVWMGHTGLIGHDKYGTVMFIHSTPPKVVEQPLMQYVETNVTKNKERAKKGQALFLGFKFLRLKAEELGKK